MQTQAEHCRAAMLLNGASPGQALISGLTGALIGGITAGLSNRIAGVLGHTGNYLRRAIAHGIVSGVMRLVQGGNFGSGFMSTFFSTIAGGIKVGTGWIQGAFQTLVGGTASVIGGGKFANGAVSAAMVWMFNDAMAADYAARKIAASSGIIGDMAVKNSQNASSYTEIVEARKKIDALFSNGAEIVMVVSGAGEVYYVAKGAIFAYRARIFFKGTRLGMEASAKMLKGDFHNFPKSVEGFAKNGKYFRARGGDGKIYEHLHIQGGYVSPKGNIYGGTFEFIKDSNSVITHRFFRRY